MKKIIFIVLSMILLTTNCFEQGDNCHRHLTIINNSSQDIIPTLKFNDSSNNCILTGSILNPGDNYVHDSRSCWEDRLSRGELYELYIVDPSHYNEPGLFYDCAEIESKNTVLRKYSLTLDDLKQSDFKIIYP